MNGYGSGGGVRIGSPLTDGIKILLIWNGIFFLLQEFILKSFVVSVGGVENLRFEQLFGIVPWLITTKGFLWQVVTYMFLHGSFTHIFFNMLALWMFGGDLERLWGTRRFLIFYFFTGISAGILNILFAPSSQITIIGASGAVYAILFAYAYYFPERRIYVYFLFPVPVRIFVFFYGGAALLFSLTSSSGGGIAHIVHLGGLIFAWVFIKWIGPMITNWERQRKKQNPDVVDFTKDQDFWRR